MPEIIFDPDKINVKPNSTIKNITIFPGYALVEREQKLHIGKGEQTVEFTGIGGACLIDTVKAKTLTPDITILSVSPEIKYLHFFNKIEHDVLYKKVKDVLHELVRLFDEKTVFSLEAALIADLRLYLKNTLNDILLEQHIAIEKLREALDFLTELLSSNKITSIEKDVMLHTLEEEYERLFDEYEEIRKIDTRTTFTVKVEITAKQECDALFICSYMAGNVSWRPSYDALLDTNKNELTLSMYAEILQHTGEDWEQVPIVISTAEVDTGIIIPKLYPTVLSGNRETISTDIVTGTEDIDDLAEGEESEPVSDETLKHDEDDTLAEKKGTAYTFTLAKPATIMGNGLWNRVLIQKFEQTAAVNYETIPSHMPYVYLKASFKNDTGSPFPAGSAQIFRNNSYMGKTSIQYIADKEECAFSFGIDDDIKVRRKIVRDVYKAAKGLGGRHIREFIYEYELSHYKEKPVTVVLKEAIHKSEVAGVKVKIEDKTTPGYEHDRHGVVSFTKELAAKKFERTTIKLAYTIDAKKKFSLEQV